MNKKGVCVAAVIVILGIAAIGCRGLFRTGYREGMHDANIKPIRVTCEGDGNITLDMGDAIASSNEVLGYFVKAAKDYCYTHRA